MSKMEFPEENSQTKKNRESRINSGKFVTMPKGTPKISISYLRKKNASLISHRKRKNIL